MTMCNYQWFSIFATEKKFMKKMKKINRFVVMALAMAAPLLGNAQVTELEGKLRTQNTDTTEGWKVDGVFSLTASQTSLTNWAAGGNNSVSGNALFSIHANYIKSKNTWENSLDLGYGIMKQGEEENFRKTDDRVDFLSKYGREAIKNFYYSAMLNFKTQMYVGKQYGDDTIKISNFLAPAYVVGAIGMDYKPNNHFSAFIAPFTSKTTIVNDQSLADRGLFGVKAAVRDEDGTKIKDGEKIFSEFGGYIRLIYTRSDFEAEFLKNVTFTTKADFFSNYLNEPQNIDVSWETQITMKVNKFITLSLNTHLMYDDNIHTFKTDADGNKVEHGAKVQFKEIAGVGIQYKF